MIEQTPSLLQQEPVKRSELLAIMSDPHCGSSVGLMPPRYKTLEGITVLQSPFQGWLWECWLDWIQFCKDVRGDSLMAGVINGDCIEGVHHGTKQIMSSDTGDHKGIAIESLGLFTDLCAKAYLVKGTECHVNSGEVSIAHALKLQVNPDFSRALTKIAEKEDPDEPDGDEKTPEGAYVFQRLHLNVNGLPFVARHHMPTSMRRNLAATQLSIQLAEEQLEAANNGEPIPHILAMAHRHKTGHYQDDESLALVTGAWQGLTNFGHKVVSPSRCKPSGYILDWRGKQPGELPTVHFRRYRPPHQTTIDL